MWRGPTHDGISAETGWSPEAVAAGKVLWRAQVGKGHSSFSTRISKNPAVSDGRTPWFLPPNSLARQVIYAASQNGSQPTSQRFQRIPGVLRCG